MKKYLKRFWNYLGGISGFLFALYLFLILSVEFVNTYDLTTFRDNDRAAEDAVLMIFRYILMSAAVSLIISPLILKAVSFAGGRVLGDGEDVGKKRTLIYFLVPFAVLFISYIVYYPGCYDADSITQYNQSFMNGINDWHPAIHTLLAIKLPILITFKWLGAPALIQIIFFALAIGFTLCSVEKYAGKRLALGLMIFIIIHPQTRNLFVSPVKDCAFAILALLLIAFALNIYFTDGEWAKKPINTAALIVILVFATLVRHNGILFTLPYAFALFFMISKKRATVIALCVLALIAVIKYPLYSALKVAPAPQRQVEITGLPMSVIGAVASNSPEALDDETREFVYKVAPAEIWEKYYRDNGYNSIKNEYCNNDVIEEYGANRVVKMAMKCLAVSPFYAFKGIIKLTEGVYSVNGDYLHYTDPSELMTVEIPMKGIPALQKVNRAFTIIVTVAFPHLFMYVGAMHLLIMAGIILSIKKKRSIKGILFALPVFVYDFGTMLLLTDSADTARFFYYTFPVTPLLMLMLLKENKNKTAEGKAR